MAKVRDDFKNNLLELKKTRFKETVSRTSNEIGVPKPKVVFFKDEDWDSGDEIAHYHPDIYEIHILESMLAKLSYEDIEDTASHEVEHARDDRDESNPVHSSEFYKRHDKTKGEIWQPPNAGVIQIRSTDKIKKIKSKKSREDKTRCNYHLCRKKTKLEQCPHCSNWFCNEHIDPYTPRMFNSKEGPHRGNGHPCVNYTDYLILKKKEQEKAYGDALNRVLKDKKNVEEKTYDYDEAITKGTSFTSRWLNNISEAKKKRKEEEIIKNKIKRKTQPIIVENYTKKERTSPKLSRKQKKALQKEEKIKEKYVQEEKVEEPIIKNNKASNWQYLLLPFVLLWDAIKFVGKHWFFFLAVILIILGIYSYSNPNTGFKEFLDGVKDRIDDFITPDKEEIIIPEPEPIVEIEEIKEPKLYKPVTDSEFKEYCTDKCGIYYYRSFGKYLKDNVFTCICNNAAAYYFDYETMEEISANQAYMRAGVWIDNSKE